MNTYVKEINKLTKSENLVEANLKYVMKVAHRYKGNGLSLEDLVQEGNYGLVVAANKFDESRGVKFLTFATPYILKYIKAALGNNRSIVSEPGSFQHKSHMVRKAKAEFKNEHGVEPTTSDIAALTGYTEDVVNSTLRHEVNYTISLDKPVNEDDERTVESIFDSAISYDTPSDLMDGNDRMEILEQKLSELDERSREAIRLRFIEDMTLNEVGIRLGLTPAGTSGVINKALKKMRG